MKTFGYTFSKEDRHITGEQSVLRYSALDCWLKNKDAYRKRYYEGQEFQTAEMVFGHRVHKSMELKSVVKKDPLLSQLPRYSRSEYNIEEKLEDIKIGGCLDSFEKETFSFLDYKSSHLSKDGKIPWDNVRVAKHMQLVFYSLLVFLRHGKVDPWVKLIWLETAFRKKSIEFEGHTLSTETRELYLTGKFKVFKRRIYKYELDHLRGVILNAAEEINKDFISYKAQR